MGRARTASFPRNLPAMLLAGAALACALKSNTAPFAVEGRIVDGRTGAPLPGTQVSIEGTELAVLADESGRFVLRGEALPGRYRVRIQIIGYTTLTRAVRFDGSSRVRLGDVGLDVEVIPVDDLVVQACRQQREPPADTVTWRVDEGSDSLGRFWLLCPRAPR